MIVAFKFVTKNRVRIANRFQTDSNYTLAALASEIPGFKVDQRKINGENKKVACGPRTKFYEFLIPDIQEVDE